MIKYLLLLLLPSLSFASDFKDWHILELKESYLDLMTYTWAVEPFLAPTYRPTNRIDVHLDLDLFDKVLFFNNMIHSETDTSQYRLIGWNYRFGVRLGDSVQLYMEHFSQHLLDYPTSTSNTYDAIGLRIYLYRDKNASR